MRKQSLQIYTTKQSPIFLSRSWNFPPSNNEWCCTTRLKLLHYAIVVKYDLLSGVWDFQLWQRVESWRKTAMWWASTISIVFLAGYHKSQLSLQSADAWNAPTNTSMDLSRSSKLSLIDSQIMNMNFMYISKKKSALPNAIILQTLTRRCQVATRQRLSTWHWRWEKIKELSYHWTASGDENTANL